MTVQAYVLIQTEVGKAADMVLIDWESVAYPYLDEMTPTCRSVMVRSSRVEPLGHGSAAVAGCCAAGTPAARAERTSSGLAERNRSAASGRR